MMLPREQWAFLRRPLRSLERAHRNYGDLVALPLNGRRVIAVFGPGEVEAVHQALGGGVEIAGAAGIEMRPRDDIQGRGPLNSTGKDHARYRRICHRALGQDSLASYATVAIDETQRLVDTWRPGTRLDLLPEITALTRRIFKTYMFGADIAAVAPEVDAAVDTYIDVLESTPQRIATTYLSFPVPGLARRADLRAGRAAIDARIAAIAGGRVRPTRYSLAQAMIAELENAGLPPQPALVRDFVLQLHFAGLTSLASAMVWALLLLALNPEPARELVDELDGTLGGRIPCPEDARRLPYLEAVLNEAMRLYPAAAWEFKGAISPIEVGGHLLPAGTPLLLVPWVTQRSVRSFEEPLEFRPRRFLRGLTYPSGAFQPWGTGERSCIGKSLARHAFRSVVGGIVQRFRLDLVAGQRIEPNPGLLGNRLLPSPRVEVTVAAQDGETWRSFVPTSGSVSASASGARRADRGKGGRSGPPVG
ncbi:cytochrome P450 [Micromonospora sp. NPDC048935]|uniref:cytochrome P450 n=1 Tax=Micromonospora sp. NPDC048935 TaxID=3364262 RepID=UPI00372039F1